MLDITLEDLKKTANSFYALTNIKMVLYDESRNLIYAYPTYSCGFCTAVRSDQVLNDKCLNCDKIGFDECDQIKKPYIYKCHMNLTEVITPIYENGITIGYMMMGQILNKEDRYSVLKKISQAASEYSVDREKLLNGLNELTPLSNEHINAAIDIMSMCVCYLHYNNIIKNNPDMITHQLKKYIDTHLSEALTIGDICNQFYMSKSHLYNLSKQAFGEGITDYIRRRRIERAKALLRASKRSVSQIAEEVGITDANYFTRIFKQYEGTTPLKYRKRPAAALHEK